MKVKKVSGSSMLIFCTAAILLSVCSFPPLNFVEAAPFLVKDIVSGSLSSNPRGFTVHDGALFFIVDEGIHGWELWKSDGTEAGTVLVKDINPGPDGSFPGELTSVGALFFIADDGIHGRELWKSDGTEAGTVLVKDITPGPNALAGALSNIGGMLSLTADDGIHGAELWKSDGTEAGTVLVKDINPGPNGSNPGTLINVDGTFFFIADDGVHGLELWKSDGTEAGTVLINTHLAPDCVVIETPPFIKCSFIGNLTNAGGTLFFTTNDGVTGTELWKSDGTEAGTHLVKDIRLGPDGSEPRELIAVNRTVFFRADDGLSGYELWKSDGTEEGTVLVKDIRPGPDLSEPQELINVDGTLFFRANDGIHSWELWKSDGTEAGTVMVKDINPGPNFSLPSGLTNVNGTLLFFADDGVSGTELWKSDGTEASTELVTDINPGAASAIPSFFTTIDGTVFFSADDGVRGNELWALNIPAFSDAWGSIGVDFINAIYFRGITAGCRADDPALPGNDALYCPDQPVTRAQMAVFIETSLGVTTTPPCTGTVFSDVNESLMSSAFCGFIEDFAARGITGGCQADDPATPENEARYCPADLVTRAQMAVFIETSLGVTTAPPCTGMVFSDVNESLISPAFCGFIEDFAAKGITAGCVGDNPTTSENEARYCPDDPVTRAQMAVFLGKAFLGM